MATAPKHAAERKGKTSWEGRKPRIRPPAESSTVPATMTAVPATIGIVTDSPRRTMASPAEMKGWRLVRAAVTPAPTRSMLTKRSSRPAVVPTRPARTK